MNLFFEPNDLFRNSSKTSYVYGVGVAVALHIFVLAFTLTPQKIIQVQAQLTAPTQIHIQLKSPQKIVKPQPIKKVMKAADVKKQRPVIKKTIVKKPSKVRPETVQKIVATTPIVAETTMKTTKEYKENIQKPLPVQKTEIPVTKIVSLKGRRVAPEYPKRALRLGHEGVVFLRVLVSEKGEREDIRIYKASQYAMLDNAALRAVKKWRFKPTQIKGQFVKSWVEVPVEFKIQ